MSRSFSELSLLAVLAVTACDPFGIPATVVDGDGDGLVDGADNCPLVPNATQFDSDGDGQGDACSVCESPIGSDLDDDGYDDRCDLCIGAGVIGVDVDADGIDDGCDPCIAGVGTFGIDVAPADGIDDGCQLCRTPTGADGDNDGLDDACDDCMSGPPHDEDSDGLADRCDNCPLIANADQAFNTTDVMVGAACDPAASEPHVRLLFDSFVEETEQWTTTGTWRVEDDRAFVESGEATRDNSFPFNPASTRISARLSDLPSGASGYAGIITRDFSGTQSTSCRVDSNGMLIFDGPEGGPAHAEAPGVVGGGPILLELVRPMNPPSALICTATSAGATPISVSIIVFSANTFGLIAGGSASFDAVDVVSAFGPPPD